MSHAFRNTLLPQFVFFFGLVIKRLVNLTELKAVAHVCVVISQRIQMERKHTHTKINWLYSTVSVRDLILIQHLLKTQSHDSLFTRSLARSLKTLMNTASKTLVFRRKRLLFISPNNKHICTVTVVTVLVFIRLHYTYTTSDIHNIHNAFKKGFSCHKGFSQFWFQLDIPPVSCIIRLCHVT